MSAVVKTAVRTLRCPCVVGRCTPFPDCADCSGTGLLDVDAVHATATIQNLHRIYRAHVSTDDYRRPERTVFVEAGSERAAATKIIAAVAAIEQRPATEVEERVYNCTSARELIETGESRDLELRIFETAWGAQTLFVEEPVFLVDQPAALCRKWMQAQEVSPRRNV